MANKALRIPSSDIFTISHITCSRDRFQNHWDKVYRGATEHFLSSNKIQKIFILDQNKYCDVVGF